MEEIQYIGEHLLPGQIGHVFILLAFVASLLATGAYIFATNKRDTAEFASWRKIGRISFSLHTISVFSIIGLIFYVMLNKYYEYHYVFEHVSDDLPFKYIFSAFWEGQEGSFLLWMFWHVVLGMILMFTAKKWESPVLAMISLVQVFVSSMILGIFIGDYKIGSNPLVLFRDVSPLPLFNNADYVVQLGQFADGLNPLLQNYWMTIHPPTLFLGFASTIVPFCFAIASLWMKDYKGWLKPVLPWALFSGAILGTGILMGGAWAYEALSFGGYWAWDPVENTSLVPWIILVAGIHTNLVARNTGHAIKSTYAFYLLTFIMIVYSTTLTRSGVLGDTSVHAFTEMGLENQLLVFILSCVAISIGFYVWNAKSIPVPVKEEKTPSREFWMFIGSLVLLFSAILITFTTSIPVYNKVAEALFNYDLNWSAPVDVVAHYNKYQLWIGVFVGGLSGFAQFLRYKAVNWQKFQRKFWLHIGVSVLISVVLTYLCSHWINMQAWQYLLLGFTGIFTVISNLDYLVTVAKGNLKLASSAVAHVGFGVMVIGIMASGLNKKHISTNPFAQRGLLNEEMLGKNVLLFEGIPMFMSGYEVTFVKDTVKESEFIREFTVNYKKYDDEKSEVIEEFNLYPNALYDTKFTKIASTNPSTKHYWDKDIFSHIASLPPSLRDAEEARAVEDSLDYRLFEGRIGESFMMYDTTVVKDSTFIKEFEITLNSINRNPTHPDYIPEEGDLAMGLNMSMKYIGKDTVYQIEPVAVIRGPLMYSFPSQINKIATKVRLKEETLMNIIPPEEELGYQKFDLQKGEKINFNGMEITFESFDKEATSPAYQSQEGDIAVGANIKITTKESTTHEAHPIFLIRGSRPMDVKDEVTDLGLHFRFMKVNPQTEKIELLIAQKDVSNEVLPIEIATNSFRDDWIVLEAIEFPGIKLVWLGSIMMMFGLGMGMFGRFGKV